MDIRVGSTVYGSSRDDAFVVQDLLDGWKDHNTILKCYQQPDQEKLRASLETSSERVLRVV